jgi:hypothetical protein
MPEAQEQTRATHTPGPLTYTEGDMLRPSDLEQPFKACWLEDADGEVVAAVTEGADFERSKVMLKHAAHATQVLPALLAACKQYVALDDLWRQGKAIAPSARADLDIAFRDAIAKAESH